MDKQTQLIIIIVGIAFFIIFIAIFAVWLYDKGKNKSTKKVSTAKDYDDYTDEEEEEEPAPVPVSSKKVKKVATPDPVVKLIKKVSKLEIPMGAKITLQGKDNWSFHFQQADLIYLSEESSTSSIQFFKFCKIEKAEWSDENLCYTMNKSDDTFIVMVTNEQKKPVAVYVYDINGKQVL